MIHNVIDSIISPQTTRQPIPQQIHQATAILGYSGGNSWPTWNPYRAARPDLAAKHWVVPVTLSCTAFGHVYDIEPGGGSNRNIGIFMHNARNVWKTQNAFGPQWLYTFASNGAAMLAAARRFGYVQGRDFYYLAAHPNSRFGEHICHPELCGFPRADGTQHLFAGAFDTSVLNDYMLHGAKPAPPQPPKPLPEATTMIQTYSTGDRKVGFVVETSKGEVLHIEQQNPNDGSGRNTDFWRTADGHPHWLSLGTPGA